MNRPIKFRAWDKSEKQMIYSPQNEADDWFVGLLNGEQPEDTLMQFTGLLDKNGKEIYEGDIINLGGDGSIYDETGNWWAAAGSAGYDKPEQEVVWSNDVCGFYPFAKYDSDCGVQMRAEKTEVIGNVWENPELLK